MTLVALAVCAVAVGVVSLRVWTHRNVPGEPHVPRYALQDFRDAVYYPARAFLDGRNPYDQPRYVAAYPVADGLALYSPLTLLLHAPLAWLPYRAAELAYYVATVAATIALGWLALVLCGVPVTVARVAGLGAVLVASRPGHWNLFNGQVTLQAVVPTILALWWARDRPLLAAAAFAVTTFKPTYGLPLAALLLARGDWRPVVIGGVVAGALTALVLVRLVGAAGGVGPFVASIESSYEARGAERRKQPEHSPFRVDVVALAGRMLGRSPGNAETLVLTLATLGLGALGVRRVRDDGTRAARAHATAIACLAVVACAYHQQYDLPILALPLVALVWGAGAWPWRAAPGLRAAALALVALPLANYLASETGITTLGLSPSALLWASSANAVALLALLALYVVTAGTPSAAAPAMVAGQPRGGSG